MTGKRDRKRASSDGACLRGPALITHSGLEQFYTIEAEDLQQSSLDHDASGELETWARAPRMPPPHGHTRRNVKRMVPPPSRSKSCETLGKRGSVKAIAALFETHGLSPGNSPSSQEESSAGKQTSPAKHPEPEGGLWIQATPSSPCECGRPPGPVWLRYIPQNSPAPATGEEPLSSSLAATQERRETAVLGDKAASGTTAAQVLEQRRKNDVLGRPSQVGISHSMPVFKSSETGRSTPDCFGPVSSLGTRVSYCEQPLIARHLSRTRPLSTPPPARQIRPNSPVMDASPLGSATLPRGTMMLYSRINNLQRHLATKNEEVSHFWRQLKAQEAAEMGSLSEQLRTAHGDLSMWKERAEAAEKRLEVLDRLSTRLKTIKGTLSQKDNGRTDEDVPSTPEPAPTQRSRSSDGNKDRTPADKDSAQRGLTGQRKASGPTIGGNWSDESGETEDAGVVAASIRKCLHHRLQPAAAHDGTLDCSHGELSHTIGRIEALGPRMFEEMSKLSGSDENLTVALELANG